MAKDIYWHLPGMTVYFYLNQVVIKMMKDHPERFREGYRIGSVYGTFPGAIWNGGRAVFGITPKSNIEKVIGDSNIVIDALDNVLTRVIVSRAAKENGIPYIHGAIHGTLGQVTVFLPNSEKTYEEMFNLPSIGKDLNDDVIEELKGVTSGVPPVIGPTPNLIGCLEAFEAYKILTGVGKVTVAPKILTFDLLDLASFNMEEI